MPKITENMKAFAFLTGFVFIWAFSVLLMFVGVRILPSIVVVAARALVAAVFMIIFFGKLTDLNLDRRTLIELAVAGLLGIAIAPLFQIIKQYSYAPSASDVVFILCLAPVFMLLGSFIFLEKPTFEKIIGISIAVLGVVCVLANWEQPSSFAPFSKFIKSEVWMLGSAIAFAGFTVMGKRLIKKNDPLVVATFAILFGNLPLVFFAFYEGQMGEILRLYSGNWIVVLLLGIFGTALGTVFWFKALAKVEISKAGSIMFLAPILITIPTVFERQIGIWGITPMMTTPIIVGAILVILGIVIVWREPTKSETVEWAKDNG